MLLKSYYCDMRPGNFVVCGKCFFIEYFEIHWIDALWNVAENKVTTL